MEERRASVEEEDVRRPEEGNSHTGTPSTKPDKDLSLGDFHDLVEDPHADKYIDEREDGKIDVIHCFCFFTMKFVATPITDSELLDRFLQGIFFSIGFGFVFMILDTLYSLLMIGKICIFDLTCTVSRKFNVYNEPKTEKKSAREEGEEENKKKSENETDPQTEKKSVREGGEEKNKKQSDRKTGRGCWQRKIRKYREKKFHELRRTMRLYYLFALVFFVAYFTVEIYHVRKNGNDETVFGTIDLGLTSVVVFQTALNVVRLFFTSAEPLENFFILQFNLIFDLVNIFKVLDVDFDTLELEDQLFLIFSSIAALNTIVLNIVTSIYFTILEVVESKTITHVVFRKEAYDEFEVFRERFKYDFDIQNHVMWHPKETFDKLYRAEHEKVIFLFSYHQSGRPYPEDVAFYKSSRLETPSLYLLGLGLKKDHVKLKEETVEIFECNPNALFIVDYNKDFPHQDSLRSFMKGEKRYMLSDFFYPFLYFLDQCWDRQKVMIEGEDVEGDEEVNMKFILRRVMMMISSPLVAPMVTFICSIVGACGWVSNRMGKRFSKKRGTTQKDWNRCLVWWYLALATALFVHFVILMIERTQPNRFKQVNYGTSLAALITSLTTAFELLIGRPSIPCERFSILVNLSMDVATLLSLESVTNGEVAILVTQAMSILIGSFAVLATQISSVQTDLLGVFGYYESKTDEEKSK